MEYQKKKKSCKTIHQINHLNLEQKIELKQMMIHGEGIAKIF